MKKAWITGAGGLIGSHLANSAPRFAPGWMVKALTREQLDLQDSAAVTAAFQADLPDLIIHCAALSRSPACEADPELARRLNVDITVFLANLAERISFIFFSTDLVFDGRVGHYTEDAAPHPLSVYSQTKVAAETAVLLNPRHTVIRTSLNGGVSPTGDRSFSEQMRNAWRRGQTLKLFVDEYRSPIPVEATARATWELAAGERTGIYHLAGAERLSRYRIGELLAAKCPELKPKFEAASVKDHPDRPPDTSFNCARVQALLSFPLPALTDWLNRPNVEVF